MKKYILVCFLITNIVLCYSQGRLTGTYDTDFGVIKIVEETNKAIKGKTEVLIYGDYRNLGNIQSTEVVPTGLGYTVKGIFMNGKDQGSFEWFFPEFQSAYNSFKGKWGWGSKLNGGKWDGKKRVNTTLPTDLKFTVWSGNWDTDFGKIFLKQNGNLVTGDYRDLGAINGTVEGNTLKGTFYNKGTKGSFEFTINGNKFIGKWGWGTKLDEGKWNGTKTLKTNAQTQNSTTASTTSKKEIRYRLTLDKIYVNSVDDGPEGIFAGYELFGIGWCRAYDSNGKQIQSFDVTYADQYGRFWEIKPKDYIKTDMRYGAQYEIGKQITFDFPVHNTNNMDEFLRKSKIELTIELKDYDTATASDILGKERVVIPLNEANIPKYSSTQFPSSNQKGVVNIKHGKGHLLVTFFIEKLN